MSEDTEDQDALVRTSVSLPRYLHDWVSQIAKKKPFNSQSSVMIVALSELKGKLDHIEAQRQGKPELELLLVAYLQTEEGKAILDKINKKDLNKSSKPQKNSSAKILFDKDWEREDILE